MTVKGLTGNAKFFAEVTDMGFFLPHRGYGQADFGCRHLVGATAVSASGACGGEAGDGAL